MAVEGLSQPKYIQEVEIDDTDSPYTVDSLYDVHISVDTTNGAVTINLPAIAVANDRQIVQVSDEYYKFSTNSVTINPNGSDTTENDTDIVLRGNRDICTLRANNTTSNWKIV